MKIVVQLVIEVDAEAWTEVYGTEKNEIRQDVKSYVLTSVQGSAGIEESGADVTLR